jgi:hypothetical protein
VCIQRWQDCFPDSCPRNSDSLRIFGFDQNTVRRVIDLNGYFAEPFRFVGALHGIDFYFVTVPDADVNVAVNV